MGSYCRTIKSTLVKFANTAITVDSGTIASLFAECPALATDSTLTLYSGQTAGRTRASESVGDDTESEVTAPSPIVTKPQDIDQMNPYFGGYPGAKFSRTDNIGDATWNFEASLESRYGSQAPAAKIQFRWVKYDSVATPCTPSSPCTGLEVCGTSLNPAATSSSLRMNVGKCGTQYGYWSANAICGKTVDGFPVNSFINCKDFHKLYRCDEGIKSCYAVDATDSCCGCVNWNDYNIPVGKGNDPKTGLPFTGKCVKANPEWVGTGGSPSMVLKSLLWMKDACPTCYVYPFDDKSSTFIAASDKTFATPNMVNYVVMSCPSDIAVTYPAIEPGYRKIKFYNNCPYDVWPAIAGGAQNNKASTPESKSTQCDITKGDGDCHLGTACIKTGDINQCFWKNPLPVSGTYKLMKGESLEWQIPIQPDNNPIIFSGVVGARMLCNDSDKTKLCEISDCRKGDVNDFICRPSQGLSQPSTQAEFTFQKNAADYFDITIIDGLTCLRDQAACVGGLKMMPSV